MKIHENIISNSGMFALADPLLSSVSSLSSHVK